MLFAAQHASHNQITRSPFTHDSLRTKRVNCIFYCGCHIFAFHCNANMPHHITLDRTLQHATAAVQRRRQPMRADTHHKTGQKPLLLPQHCRRCAVEWSSVCLPLTAAYNCKMSLMACAHAQRPLIAFNSPARVGVRFVCCCHRSSFSAIPSMVKLLATLSKCASYRIQVWHGLLQSANGITYSQHPNCCSYICTY